jgi:hypothetical protein
MGRYLGIMTSYTKLFSKTGKAFFVDTHMIPNVDTHNAPLPFI